MRKNKESKEKEIRIAKVGKWLQAKPSRSASAILLVFILCLSACFGSGTVDKSEEKSTTEPEKSELTADEKNPISSPDLSVFDNFQPQNTQGAGEGETAGSTPSETITENPGGNIGSSSTVVSPVIASNIPAYSGQDYIALNGNVPSFAEGDFSAGPFKYFSELDGLGRCGMAYMMAGPEYLPSQDRGDISNVYPSGWVQNNCSGTYIWNRSHLLAFSLSGENDNPKNLITGTEHMNQDVMTAFESMVRDYIKETGHHVLYRVTPVFEGNNLVAKGVQMEAQDVETRGADILFNVFVYNVQPGASIDYGSGNTSCSAGNAPTAAQAQPTAPYAAPAGSSSSSEVGDYVVNIRTKKIHRPGCGNLNRTKEANKQAVRSSLDDLHAQGYEDAGCCLR